VTVAFKSGLFNIGATGQMLSGGMCAVWVGFTMHGPGIVQIPLAIAAGIVGGAFWGGMVGLLKARTGAHEVITTIMLNYVISFLALWVLKTETFIKPGRSDPISRQIDRHSRLPRLLSFLGRDRTETRAHIGFVIALVAVFLVWWLLNRSKRGFELRTVGANAHAARYAGMNAGTLTILAMAISGGLAGLAGASEVLGTNYQATDALAGNIGFDAIAVALLGKTSPIGTAWAALLFGVFEVGGKAMESEAKVPSDLSDILRALIVLFIAAPLLTRAIWRMKTEDSTTALAFKGWGG
jgi:simple sugar transport system permease protein